jgi:3-oxoadipate enol-lactonase
MVALAYDIDGDDGAPTLLLGSSLGADAGMWRPQVGALRRHFRVVRYDHRGHGRSPVPGGDYDLEDLGRDVLSLMDTLEVERVSYAGVSFGGMVGMWLAINAPERVDRLALICTSAHLTPASAWRDRADLVRAGGMAPVAETIVGRWFTPSFRRTSPEVIAEVRRAFEATSPAGYSACCLAIGGMDLREGLGRITAPTLVIGGADDEAIPPAHGEAIAAAVPGARFELVNGAHLTNVENAATITPLLVTHLAETR